MILSDKIRDLKLCNRAIKSNLDISYQLFLIIFGFMPFSCSFIYMYALKTNFSIVLFIAAIINLLFFLTNRNEKLTNYVLSITLFRKKIHQREKINLELINYLKKVTVNIENGSTANINDLYEIIKLKNYAQNSYLLNEEIDKFLKSYNNNIKSYKSAEGVYEVKLNFGENKQSIYVTSREVKDLLSQSIHNINLIDFVRGTIDYKSPAIIDNIETIITMEKIKILQEDLTENNKSFIEFLIFVKDFVRKGVVKDFIEQILGQQLFNTNANSVNTIPAQKNEIEQLIESIDLRKENLSLENGIQFSALKEDYLTAKKLKVINNHECFNIFKTQFSNLLDNCQLEEKNQQEKFIRYLKKMN